MQTTKTDIREENIERRKKGCHHKKKLLTKHPLRAETKKLNAPHKEQKGNSMKITVTLQDGRKVHAEDSTLCDFYIALCEAAKNFEKNNCPFAAEEYRRNALIIAKALKDIGYIDK